MRTEVTFWPGGESERRKRVRRHFQTPTAASAYQISEFVYMYYHALQNESQAILFCIVLNETYVLLYTGHRNYA